jgi:hypothetical protein
MELAGIGPFRGLDKILGKSGFRHFSVILRIRKFPFSKLSS